MGYAEKVHVPPTAVALVTMQLVAEGVVVGLGLWATGSVGFLLPALAGAGVALFHGYRRRQDQTCGRGEVRRLALASGAAHFVSGAMLYGLAWHLNPGAYGFSGIGILGPACAVGMLVGGVAFAAATTALDLGVHLAGGVDAESERPRSFREPPG